MLEQSRSIPNRPSSPQINYHHLQSCVDLVVGKIGLPKTINLLESFIGSTTKGLSIPRAKVIMTYMISKSVEVFDLNERRFYKSREPQYCQARMACFHLMRKHTAYSLAEIGKVVRVSKKTPFYFDKKCESALTNESMIGFREKYEILENYVIDFISHLINEESNDSRPN